MNGILINNYDDKFIPEVQSFMDPENKLKNFVINIDLLDAYPQTHIEVYPDVVVFEGERNCTTNEKIINEFTINTRKCGKFLMEVSPPEGFYLID